MTRDTKDMLARLVKAADLYLEALADSVSLPMFRARLKELIRLIREAQEYL